MTTFNRMVWIAALALLAKAATATANAGALSGLSLHFTSGGPDVGGFPQTPFTVNHEATVGSNQNTSVGNVGNYFNTETVLVEAASSASSNPIGNAKSSAETDLAVLFTNLGAQDEFVTYNASIEFEASTFIGVPATEAANAYCEVGIRDAINSVNDYKAFASAQNGGTTNLFPTYSGTILIPANGSTLTTFYAYTQTTSSSVPAPTAALSFGLALVARRWRKA